MEEEEWENGKNLGREKRVNYYRDIIERTEPVYEFFDDLDNGMTYDELIEELQKVRTVRKKIEVALKLDADEEFCTWIMQLKACIVQIRNFRIMRIKEMQINEKCGRPLSYGEATRLKELERNTHKYAHEIETKIFIRCVEMGGDPDEYCYLEQLDD